MNFTLPHQFGGFNDPMRPQTVTIQSTVEETEANTEPGQSPKITKKIITEEIDIPGFENCNLFKEDIDLPQIRPRTLVNRNEFYIEIPKLPELIEGISKEEAKKAIGRNVLTDWE